MLFRIQGSVTQNQVQLSAQINRQTKHCTLSPFLSHSLLPHLYSPEHLLKDFTKYEKTEAESDCLRLEMTISSPMWLFQPLLFPRNWHRTSLHEKLRRQPQFKARFLTETANSVQLLALVRSSFMCAFSGRHALHTAVPARSHWHSHAPATMSATQKCQSTRASGLSLFAHMLD